MAMVQDPITGNYYDDEQDPRFQPREVTSPVVTTPPATTTTGSNTDDDSWRRDETKPPHLYGRQPREGHQWFWDASAGQWVERPYLGYPTTKTNNNEFGGYGDGSYHSPAFNWPTFNAPRYTAPADFAAPPPFSFEAFRAPTLEDARNEPGYAFAADEGRRQLEQSAAARGVLRTGGTLKDILGWGNRFAEQNYGNVFNRGAQTYGMNRENALGNYLTNYNISRDVYDRGRQSGLDVYDRDYQAALAEFNPRFRSAELTFDDMYRRWKAMVDANTAVATAGAGA